MRTRLPHTRRRQTINGPDYWIPEYDNYLNQIYQRFPKSFVAVHLLLSTRTRLSRVLRCVVVVRSVCMGARAPVCV